MENFIKSIDGLPFIIKIILCLPVLDIIWGIYRIVKGISTKNNLLILVGILWIIPFSAISWAVDLICMIFKNELILA